MESRKLIVISIVLYLVALCLLTIGFAAPTWVQFDITYSGLWKFCSNGCVNINVGKAEAFHQATVAFMIMAFIAAILAFFGYLILIAGGILQLVAGVLELLAVVIFAGSYNDKYNVSAEYMGFSVWLCMVSGILFVVNGALLTWIAKKLNIDTKPKLPISV